MATILTTGNATELELMIDRHGLSDVLATLSNICSEKAEHLRSNWQDKNAARDWDKAATAIDYAVNKTLDLF